jgi:adenosine deaminase
MMTSPWSWHRLYSALAALIALMIILGAFSAAAAVRQQAGASDEALTAAYFESIRDNPNLLRAFFHEMPKGADIHNHLTGAVYAETVIDISAAHGLKADPVTGRIPSDQSTPGLVSVATAYDNQTFYDLMVDDWSMRDYPYRLYSGHDAFFATFSQFTPEKVWAGAMIQSLRSRAQAEHVSYIETMLSVHNNSQLAAAIVGSVDWNDDLAVLRRSLLDAGLDAVAERHAAAIAGFHEESLKPWGGDESKTTTVRYLYEAGRTAPKEEVFANMVLAFEVANRSPLVVGVNLVGPEDSYHARADYDLHMQMLAFLHKAYPDVRVALHAGELTLGLVPPEDLLFHVHDALYTAKARRIGHGVDIMYEEDATGTLAYMSEQQIPVEILLTSNAEVLGIEGEEHPIMIYKEAGVPIVLASDDPGVERTDLTAQYMTAAATYPGLTYQDFREFAWNSMQYSFLPGKDLRAAPDSCTAGIGTGHGLSPECESFLARNQKAAQQRELEEDLAAFEKKMALLAPVAAVPTPVRTTFVE